MDILSVENQLGWSWGIVIQRLRENLPDHKVVRILRGVFKCQNPRCKRTFFRDVEPELVEHFDVVLLQNVDNIKLIGEKTERAVARVGGMDMRNPDSMRYGEDFKKVSAIIATNETLADIAKQSNPNTVVIPNGVDLERFKPPTPCPNLDRKFCIGFAGNIAGGGAEYKGWQYFVQAGVQLMLQGVEQRHLLHNVNQIPHHEMPEGFYHLIDALVLPSMGEGCSNVVSEALACGVPVLTTKVGFHGEKLVDGENCLFIERSEDSIKAAVMKLVESPDLRTKLSQNGRKFAEEVHDVKKVAAAYDRVFREVIEKTRRKVG